MSAYTLSLRLCGCLSLVLLGGCHARTANPPLPQARTALTSSTPFTVQQDAAYKTAVVQYSRRDFSRALGGINALLAEPQYAHSPADHTFLLHQRAICRHAIDPRVPATESLASPPPVRFTHVPLTVAQADCGPRALLLLCPQFGVHSDLNTLRQKAGTTIKGTTMAGLSHAAASLGLQAKGVQVDRQALAQVSLPAIAWYDSSHYVDLLSVSEEKAVIRDPNKPKEEEISTNELLGRSGGILLTLSR